MWEELEDLVLERALPMAVVLCLFLFLRDLSNWEMYLFLFRAFFSVLLKYASCNWRLIWLPYLCLWTKFIPFISVFQYKYKSFYIESEILESPFVVQNKMTGQENWEFFANDNGQWVKLFILGNIKKKVLSVWHLQYSGTGIPSPCFPSATQILKVYK